MPAHRVYARQEDLLALATQVELVIQNQAKLMDWLAPLNNGTGDLLKTVALGAKAHQDQEVFWRVLRNKLRWQQTRWLMVTIVGGFIASITFWVFNTSHAVLAHL